MTACGEGPITLDASRHPHASFGWLKIIRAWGAETAKALNRAAREDRIAVSAITPWEIALLVSEKRIDLQHGSAESGSNAALLARRGCILCPSEPGIAVSQ